MEKAIRVSADSRCIDEVFSFVEDELLQIPGCSRSEILKFHMIVDEIFTNIANYAYGEESGDVIVLFSCDDGKTVTLVFKDEGIPYDPSSERTPDLNLPVKDRAAGGLGIFMVKSTVDDFLYERCDGWNVLKLVKSIGEKISFGERVE